MVKYTVENKIIAGLPKGKLKGANFVIAHETANSKSTIDNEVSYMTRNWKNAFVTHFVGGGGRVVQVANVNYVSWGAGQYANSYSYAQVELCRTSNATTFKKDYEVYCQLLVDLAKKAGIPITLDSGSKTSDKGIKSHKWVADKLGGTTHQDPYAYLSSWGISKAQFASDLAKVSGGGNTGTAPAKPSTLAPKPSTPSTNLDKLGLVDYMNAKKMDSSYSNRAKLAKQYGIANYSGTASQNTTLLSKIKGGAPKPSTPAPKPSTSTAKKIYFPPNKGNWSVYPTNKAPVKANAIGAINPTKFGGLTYTIQKDRGNGVYEIQTDQFGRVQVYGAPSTGAVIKK
ncbi:putative endolysin [Listeria phage 20422-1]